MTNDLARASMEADPGVTTPRLLHRVEHAVIYRRQLLDRLAATMLGPSRLGRRGGECQSSRARGRSGGPSQDFLSCGKPCCRTLSYAMCIGTLIVAQGDGLHVGRCRQQLQSISGPLCGSSYEASDLGQMPGSSAACQEVHCQIRLTTSIRPLIRDDQYAPGGRSTSSRSRARANSRHKVGSA